MTKLTRTHIKRLMEASSAAPSGGNAQPWKVTIKDNSITLNLNSKRADTFLDAAHRASLFGLGCFTTNFHIASETLGLKFDFNSHLDQFNSSAKIWTAALVSTGNSSPHPLFPYLHQRATNRKLFDGSIIADNTIAQLTKSISSFPNHHLSTLFQNNHKSQIANILGQADLIRFQNSVLRREMMQEFRWNDHETRSTKDGIDVDTLEAPPNLIELLGLVRDNPKLVKLLPKQTWINFARPLLTNSSHLCVLSGKTHQPVDWFTAGQTMQTLWLTATSLQLSIQPWSILSFYGARVNVMSGKGFKPSEIKLVKKLIKELNHTYHLDSDSVPYFTFRLSSANPPSARALRLPWQSFTTFLD